MGRLGFALGSGTETRSAAGEAPLPPGVTAAHVAIDGREAGRILFADRIRPEASRTFERLRALGVARIVLVTGDRRDVADKVAATIGADAVVADATPEAKVAVAREEQLRAPTLMIGDGINDAPVLASAEIGVAMGARGAAAASEAADMIVMVDSLDRIPDAIAIAAHARHIALQSVALGLALSLIGMAAAATGHLPPVAGALLQEGIDLLAILNALRALGSGDTRQSGLSLASISARRASRKGGSASRMPS
jgi:cation transport ATPase